MIRTVLVTKEEVLDVIPKEHRMDASGAFLLADNLGEHLMYSRAEMEYLFDQSIIMKDILVSMYTDKKTYSVKRRHTNDFGNIIFSNTFPYKDAIQNLISHYNSELDPEHELLNVLFPLLNVPDDCSVNIGKRHLKETIEFLDSEIYALIGLLDFMKKEKTDHLVVIKGQD